jgi:hypothetical protein
MNARNILIGIAVLLVVVIGGLFAVISSVDVNEYRGLIAEEAEKATGRKLVIAGEADLKISLSPSISVSGVTFANASWGSQPEMLKLDSFTAEIALMPLISGDIQVKRLILSGLDVLLETDKKGTGNWVFTSGAEKKSDEASSGDEDGGSLPTVNLVELRDIRFTWHNGQTGATQKINIARLEARADGASSPLDFTLQAALDGNDITADGRLAPLAQLANPTQPWPLKVNLAAGGAKISLDGTIAKPVAAQGLDLKLSVQGQDVATLSPLAGAPLPKMGPYSIAGTLQGSPEDLVVKGLAVKMGGSDIGGDIRVRLGGAKPEIVATLAAKLLNVADFGQSDKPAKAEPAKAEPAKEGEQKRVFPADPLPLEGLSAVNANVKLKIARLLASGMTVEGVDLSAVLKDGKADVALKSATLSEGKISAKVGVDGRSGKSGLVADFKVTKLALGKMLKEMEVTDILDAAVDASGKVSGKGGSVRSIMAGLNGNLQVVSQNGTIESSYVELLAADLLKKMTSTETSTSVNCLVVGFDIKKGIATNTALLFDTTNMVVQGKGSADLREEKLDMQIEPKPKDASLLSLAVPINISGTFAEPSFAPSTGAVIAGVATLAATAINPAALLIPLLSGGSDDKNPCVTALQGGGKVATKKSKAGAASGSSAPAPAEKKDDNSVGGFFKKIIGD